MDGFERILSSGSHGRNEAAITKVFIGRSSASVETGWTGTSHETETTRKLDNGATKAGGIVVRKVIEQDVEQRV